MYWIYNVLLIFYWIGLIPVILYRLAFEDGFYERIKQSAGYMPASLLKKIEGRRAIWIHAASVGEIVATSPLVKEVKKEFPEVKSWKIANLLGSRKLHDVSMRRRQKYLLEVDDGKC